MACTKSALLPDGSSPRVRGTLYRQKTSTGTLRFIPAGAGNTCPRVSPHRWPPVHPRGCGEHFSSPPSMRSLAGSSPRVRGTQRGSWRLLRLRRFIPAGAGNTCRISRPAAPPPVHPRGCGEHRSSAIPSASFSGSSPRVRGTRTRTFGWSPLRSVHPRGCGEHTCSNGRLTTDTGSSPRVRGTQVIGNCF